MLNEVKLACGALDEYRMPELCRLIEAGIREIETRGVMVDGSFTYTLTQGENDPLPKVAEWECSITDNWVKTLILTYVQANRSWGNTQEKAALQNSFEQMLDKMMGTTGYRRGW